MPGTASSGGRNRKSAQQHRLEGTYQRRRHGGSKAPEPVSGVPVPPIKLKGVAKAEWDRMVGRLQSSKSLSVVDDAALYQYVCLFAETEALADQHEHTSGLIDKVEDQFDKLEDSEISEAIRNVAKLKQLEASYSTKVRQGRMALRAYLVEFGMTPAARSRVKVPDTPPTEDPFAEFDGSVN